MRNKVINILQVLIIIILIQWGCIHCSSPGKKIEEPWAGQNGVLNYHRGSFRMVGEIPLLFIAGTPYVRGYQYGVLLRDEIVENVAYFKNLLQEMYGAEWDAFLNAVYQREKWLPEEWMEKIHGIADGCGRLDYRDILLVNAMFGVSFCTSAAINVNGEFIHIKNHELGYQAEELPFLMIVEEDTSGHRMIYTTGYGPGTFLPTDGMNDRGISLTTNSMPPFEGAVEIKDEDKMSPFIFRYRVLSECSTLSEVENLVNSFNFVRPNGYIVVSAAENRAAKFEISPLEYGLETSGTRHLFLTNHYNIQNMQKYQQPTSWGYGVDMGTSFLVGQTLCPRYNLLNSKYKGVQYNTDRDTVSLLRDSHYFYDLDREYFGCVWVDAYISNVKVGPDDVYAWLIPEYRGLTSLANHYSLIMNPNRGHIYFAKSLTYAVYGEFKKISLLGAVNDDWNIDTESIPADLERYKRGELFHQFWGEANSRTRNILEICRDYMAKDVENVIYYESYGRMLLKEEPAEAQRFFKETLQRFPGNIFIKRLYGLSLFEVFKNSKNQSLLEEAENVFIDLLDISTKQENSLPCFILDIYYRLMLIAKEQGKDVQLKKWRRKFYDRHSILGSPGFYPFSELLAAVEDYGS